MDWELIKSAEAAPGQGLLQVHVYQNGEPFSGVRLQLHGAPWINEFSPPEEARSGDKDPALPGVVEFVHVRPGRRLMGIEVQPDVFVLVLLEMVWEGIYQLDVDLTRPWEDKETITVDDPPPPGSGTLLLENPPCST